MSWELEREPEVTPVLGRAAVLKEGARPRGHSYSAQRISQAVSLVLWANNSFRGAARSLQVLCPEAGESSPSLWSIRNWVLRLGLYELERPKPVAQDWVLILDHTIAVGQHKALLVLGVRLGELEREHFALGHQQVRILGLEIWEGSSGPKVLASLEAIREQIGGVRLIVSDAGSDLKKGAELFCEHHPQSDWIGDVSHRLARLLEAQLKEDPTWQSFVSQAAQCRSQCQQTALSALMPPAQRGKARWMNYQPLVSWGLDLLDNPVPSWAERQQYERLFGWIRSYEQELSDWWMMMHLNQETARIIKESGIASESIARARAMLQERAKGERLRGYAAGIRQYLREVQNKLRPGERLLGSSDVIESIFGKYKLLVERSAQKAITSLILAIGAVVSERTPEVVQQAMEAVRMESVQQWFSNYVGQSARSLRQKAFA
jgi:hypothetical protein